MKWIHLADLHIGKHHEAADLKADQTAVLEEILAIVREEKPDGVLIAGDVYDKNMPSEWAVLKLDWFLTELSSLCPVYMINGNHDSGERLSFGAGIMARQRVHIAGQYTGRIEPIRQGDTDIYLLPFVQPLEVRRVLGRKDITDMDSAVRAALSTCVPGTGRRKILLAHAFVLTGEQKPETSDSERRNVGTLDNVDVSAFDGFDYVALGHIHGPQMVGRETVRYAGTPLMYSFSEVNHVKSVCVVDPEQDPPVRLIPLTAGRKMRIIRGRLEEMLRPDFDPLDHGDIVLAELTDEELQVDAKDRLSVYYPNVIIQYVNRRRTDSEDDAIPERPQADPMTLFRDFYRFRSGGELTAEMEEIVLELMKESGLEVEQA